MEFVLVIGLDDLGDIFQTKCCYGSMILSCVHLCQLLTNLMEPNKQGKVTVPFSGIT